MSTDAGMGRYEGGTGEMWNSNYSRDQVLLVSAGLDPVHELSHWPSPKWDAGVAIESPPGARVVDKRGSQM